MTDQHDELTQHEIDGTLHSFNLDRRDFLKLFSGGLVVCSLASPAVVAQESGRGRGEHSLPQDIASWIHVDADNRIAVYTGKVEIGQNIRTSLAQQVAEELRVPLASISMVMGDTDLTPFDMGTFGSRTTPTMGLELRNMAMAARETLVQMAAQKWNVEPTNLTAADGRVTNPSRHESVTYGELTQGKKLLRVVGDPPLTPASDWKVAGGSAPKVDGHDFVTGRHKYPSDISRPGMLYGQVVRPAGFNAKLNSLDTLEAEKIDGVEIVRDRDFIGVTSSDAWTARRAVEAIKAKWDVPPQPSNQELFSYLRTNAESGRAPDSATGSVEQGLASADVKVETTYTVQYIAHAPLETRAAVAEWDGDKLTVWTGTQRPFGVRDELAEAFRIPVEKIRVIQPDMGSGYGGKHTGDAAVEAARLAKARGKPVKVTWSREDEFTWAYFRPAGVIDVRGGARKDGTLTAWEFHNFNSGPAGITTPYNVPNQLIQFHPVKSPLRQGSYRALAATANFFARESAMDELAHQLKIDPLEFRLKNLTQPRLRAVLEAAAEKFGWVRQKSKPEGGCGVAGGTEKGGYIAACAEVDFDRAKRQVRVRRIVTAWESGAVINPNGIRNQIEGAVVQSLGGALFEQIEFSNGRILNPHFAEYRLPRFRDLPQIDTVILDRKDLPSAGAGEIPLCGIAPAIGNAIFAATGMRLRGLPMVPDGLPAVNT
jgi:isoquinoline 1-oxidoreductase